MICDNCIHNTVCERATFENHCGYKHTEADVINPKLEKIKAEIHDIKLELDCDYYTGDKITRLIENHIEELKGKDK